MPKGLKRHYGQKHFHFVTFCCYRRRRYLDTVRARSLFVKVLAELRAKYGFFLVGYVVMPDHVHLLISEPPRATPSVVLKALKQRVARYLRKNKRHVSAAQLPPSFMNAGVGLARFWQPRFCDFNVYSRHKKREKLEYMHGNPVKRGLVKSPDAWMWSSFHFTTSHLINNSRKGTASAVPKSSGNAEVLTPEVPGTRH